MIKFFCLILCMFGQLISSTSFDEPNHELYLRQLQYSQSALNNISQSELNALNIHIKFWDEILQLLQRPTHNLDDLNAMNNKLSNYIELNLTSLDDAIKQNILLPLILQMNIVNFKYRHSINDLINQILNPVLINSSRAQCAVSEQQYPVNYQGVQQNNYVMMHNNKTRTLRIDPYSKPGCSTNTNNPDIHNNLYIDTNNRPSCSKFTVSSLLNLPIIDKQVVDDISQNVQRIHQNEKLPFSVESNKETLNNSSNSDAFGYLGETTNKMDGIIRPIPTYYSSFSYNPIPNENFVSNTEIGVNNYTLTDIPNNDIVHTNLLKKQDISTNAELSENHDLPAINVEEDVIFEDSSCICIGEKMIGIDLSDDNGSVIIIDALCKANPSTKSSKPSTSKAVTIIDLTDSEELIIDASNNETSSNDIKFIKKKDSSDTDILLCSEIGSISSEDESYIPNTKNYVSQTESTEASSKHYNLREKLTWDEYIIKLNCIKGLYNKFGTEGLFDINDIKTQLVAYLMSKSNKYCSGHKFNLIVKQIHEDIRIIQNVNSGFKFISDNVVKFNVFDKLDNEHNSYAKKI